MKTVYQTAQMSDGAKAAVLAGVLLSEAVACAALAGMPVAVGVAALCCGLAACAVFGGNLSALSPAPVAVALTWAALPSLSSAALGLFAALVGIWCLVIAVWRCRRPAAERPSAAADGAAAGILLLVCLMQIPVLQGLQPSQSAFDNLAVLWQPWQERHWPSIALGGLTLAVWWLWRRGTQPVALWLLAASVVMGAVWPMDALGVAVLPRGTWHWPFALHENATVWRQSLSENGYWLAAWALAAAVLSQPAGALRPLAARDWLTAGVGNLASAWAGGLPVSPVPADDAAARVRNRRTVWATCALSAVLLAAAWPFLGRIPVPVASALLMGTALRHFCIRSGCLWRRGGLDGAVSAAVCIGVVCLGVPVGLLFAAAAAILHAVWQRYARH